ncbi:MAG: alpha-galactosidase [Ruminococcus sp.]|nr:alpha-galactosidase [Ruminococcus sp.]
MSIIYNEKSRSFKLTAGNSCYILAVVSENYLAHVYYGTALPDDDLSYLLRLDTYPFTPEVNNRDRGVFMDNLPFEYPCYNIGDYREHALSIIDKTGSAACDLRYKSHKIYDGKSALEGLPATFVNSPDEAQTLEIVMEDKSAGLEVTLVYTAFEGLNAITRSAAVKNVGGENVKLTRVLSAVVEFDTDELDMITLNGSWARERFVERHPIRRGKQLIDSLRGESSHQNNPFTALCEHKTDEDSGKAWGFNFVYSGNFVSEAEVDQHRQTRYLMGIHGTDFEWTLAPEEVFTAPEVVMVYSDSGLGQMSRTFHDLYRRHLIRGEYKDKRRPILINNWEATYFDFNAEKLVKIAEQASALGIEMLVMDDGWFGKRDSDNCSLGDWFVNEKKLAGGLKALVDKVNALGMKFGLWFEPEMISPDSELFRAHPDWAIQTKGRTLTLCRDQCVLDYSRKEVRDCVYGMIKNILDNANIEYIKWDMNRQLTEVASAALPPERQRELWHRYVLGVYDLMNRLTTDYPHILLENCSGGGARFDPGMLYYSPQIWCSDDTDAIERLKIQAGTSMCYPCSAMGAHVSDCPNHITGRTVPFETRGHVAMVGTFGYELDVTRIPQADRDAIPGQIEEFKKYNHLVRTGDHYRIGSVFEDAEWDAWAFVAKDKSEALFEFVQSVSRPNRRSRRIRMKGLDPKEYYYEESKPDVKLSGAALMECGVLIPNIPGDYRSKLMHFIRV